MTTMFATIHAWWTVLLLVVFVGIVVWAYSARRKDDFEQAARLALDDDEQVVSGPRTPGKDGTSHG